MAEDELRKVDLNIVFTGVVSYAPANGGSCNCVDEVRFVMPNGRTWNKSKNDKDVQITPHQPFLIARERDVAVEHGKWKGKPPTGRLFRYWVYWILNSDQLRIDNDPATGVTFGNTKDVIHIPDLCPEAIVSDPCLREETKLVSARVILESGRLSQRSLTTEKYTITTCTGRKIGPKELADEVQVAIKGIPLNAECELILKRLRLDDNKAARIPIILKPSHKMIQIFCGSAPEADLGAVIGHGPNHTHGDTNVDFELHYQIARRQPYAPLPVPRRHYVPGQPAITSSPIGGVDGCPPGSNGGGG